MRPLPLMAAGLLAVTLLASPTAYAADETCQGRPATVLGLYGQRGLTGTEGPDVVVTRGALTVDTLGGDDLVCVTGGPGYGTTTLDTGAGNDVVDARLAGSQVGAVLGAGSDHYTGSPLGDGVSAGAVVDSVHVDNEPDTVIGGAGSTGVSSGTRGSTAPNSDVVLLGPGGGGVVWYGPMAAGARLDGGRPGSGLGGEVGSGTIVVDNAAGTLTEDGTQLLAWTNFDEFDLRRTTAPRSFEFRGTERDEEITMFGYPDASDGTVRIDMAGGDDRLWMGDDVIGGPGSSYAGGPGSDELVLWAGKKLDLDLRSGRMETRDSGRTVRGRVTAWEDRLVGASKVVLHGTDKDDDLKFWACEASTHGRAGNDDIYLDDGDGDFETPGCKRRELHLYGNSGKDHLRGGRANDTLIGGPGRDRVDGQGGKRDRCSGEKLRSCEIKRR